MLNQYELIRPSMDRVEDMLRGSLKSKHGIIDSAIKDLLESGGKRLRPALVIISGNVGKKRSPRLLAMATII
jgi:geranylgeranyl pyrophosphate synthase